VSDGHPDEYEAAYMGAGETIAYREKLSAPLWLRRLVPALITAAALPIAVLAALNRDLEPLLVYLAAGPTTLLTWVTFSTLRVTVTSENLIIQAGPIGPTIPLDAIESCKSDGYELWKYGGYGIRYSVIERAWCYNMIGDKGRAVRIKWRGPNGQLKYTVVASHEPERLADAVNRARAEKLAGSAQSARFVETTGARADGATPEQAESQLEVEVEESLEGGDEWH